MTKEVLIIKKHKKKSKKEIANNIFEVDSLDLPNKQFVEVVRAFTNGEISCVIVDYSPNYSSDEMSITSMKQILTK